MVVFCLPSITIVQSGGKAHPVLGETAQSSRRLITPSRSLDSLFFRQPLPLFHQSSTRHVSQRNHPLRVRLQPRHSRARPCVRIRAVRLTPHGDGSINQHRARSSITFLLPSSPSYVSPPRRRAPSPSSLPCILAAVAPTTPRPVIRSSLRISCPRPPPPPFDRAAGEDIKQESICCIGRATCQEQHIFWSLTARGYQINLLLSIPRYVSKVLTIWIHLATAVWFVVTSQLRGPPAAGCKLHPLFDFVRTTASLIVVLRFAFVEYEDRRDADDAYHDMHNKRIGRDDVLKIEVCFGRHRLFD